MNFLNGVGST